MLSSSRKYVKSSIKEASVLSNDRGMIKEIIAQPHNRLLATQPLKHIQEKLEL